MGDFTIVFRDFVDVLEGYRTQFLGPLALVGNGLFRSPHEIAWLVVRNPADDPQILRIFVEVLEVVICTQGA